MLLSESVNQQVVDQAPAIGRSFAKAHPFRHVCIDNFFNEEVARGLAQDFPAFDEKVAINEDGVVGGKAVHEKIYELGSRWQELDELVKGQEFRDLVSQFTGVPDLKYDPHYFGGGTHENRQGQYLDAHVDFNFHPITRQHRRLNLIVYLNEEWQDEWGGAIRLFKDPYLPPSHEDVRTITPLFNRCVIFETNEHSWHGFPQIMLPEDKQGLSRRSFALYYYTDTRPAEELGPEHSTIYVEEQLPEDWQPGMTLSGEQFQHMRNLLARRDQHLSRLYGNIKQLQMEVNGLREQSGTQAPPLTADEGAGQAGESSAEQLRGQLALRDADKQRLEARVAELEQSTSWRITRPLRTLKRALSGRG